MNEKKPFRFSVAVQIHLYTVSVNLQNIRFKHEENTLNEIDWSSLFWQYAPYLICFEMSNMYAMNLIYKSFEYTNYPLRKSN